MLSTAFLGTGLTVLATGADPESVAGAPRVPRQGVILNQAADALVGYLPLAGPLDKDTPREDIAAGFRKIVDQYAGTQVTCICFNTNYQRTAYQSDVWQSYWDVPDPEADTSGWPRRTWLVHRKGVDLYAVCIERCREHGISPWLSVRMNDTHYSDDPTKISSLWWDHPQWRLAGDPHNGFNFAVDEVRAHYLALLEELLHRYDADGLELDWLRFPWHFKRGEEEAGKQLLTEFMRETRKLADEAAERRGHAIGIAARVPAVPGFAIGMGMDAVTWGREGLVDLLILGSVWRPSDTDQPIEEWDRRLGPARRGVTLAAGTDLWIRGTPSGLLMMNDIQSMRGFTVAMLDRGADAIYLFNHFHHNTFYRASEGPDGREVTTNDYQELLREAGHLGRSLARPRRHVVTWHDPAPHGADNPRQLPADIAPSRAAEIRLYMGPRPTGGRVVVRVGLEDRRGMEEAVLSAQLNGTACLRIADLVPKRGSGPKGDSGSHVVKTVAEVAPRVLQFEAPTSAACRGDNRVRLEIGAGPPQRVIWLEAYVEPPDVQAERGETQ